ncbi:MAG: YfgM family protein [Gammaproteobacteria bacterium]
MEVYTSEREQIEAIRKWWQANGMAIVLGLAVGLGGLYGWQYWQRKQALHAEIGSIGFQDLISRAMNGKADESQAIGKKLLAEHGDTGYAPLAALTLAKIAVDEGKPEVARAHLEWVVANGKVPAVVDVARLRLARLALSAGKADEAWSLAGKVSGMDETAELHEVRGDIMAARNKPREAHAEYARALELATAQKADAGLLEIKIDELGVAQDATPAR